MLTRRAFARMTAASLALAGVTRLVAKDKDQLPDAHRVAYLTVELGLLAGSGEAASYKVDEDYVFASYGTDGQTRPQVVQHAGKLKYAFAYEGVDRADGPTPMHPLPVDLLRGRLDLWAGTVEVGDVVTCEFEREDGRTWAVIRVIKKEKK